MADMTFDQYINNLKQANKDFSIFAKRFVAKEAMKINNNAKRNTPVQTGALRESWNVGSPKETANNYEVQINNYMDYASYIEYGTSKGIKPTYMLKNAENLYSRDLKERFDEEFIKYSKEKRIY